MEPLTAGQVVWLVCATVVLLLLIQDKFNRRG